jgi:hypothetical protein
MIYVDELREYPTNLKYKTWCHLWTDSNIEELHNLALKIGLKRSWFQDKKRFPHYDLVPSKRKLAIENGASRIL